MSICIYSFTLLFKIWKKIFKKLFSPLQLLLHAQTPLFHAQQLFTPSLFHAQQPFTSFLHAGSQASSPPSSLTPSLLHAGSQASLPPAICSVLQSFMHRFALFSSLYIYILGTYKIAYNVVSRSDSRMLGFVELLILFMALLDFGFYSVLCF